MKSRDIFLTVIAGFALTWLWFRPIFWDMSGETTDYIKALQYIFFSDKEGKNNIGAGIDFFGTIWIFAQAEQIILQGKDSILNNIYFPTGFDLGKNTGFAWADAFVSMPLIRWLGIPGSYNLHLYVALSLTQISAIALFRVAGASFLVAVGLSSILMFNPFTIGELYEGRPTQIHWMFHCLYLLCLLKMHHGRHLYRWALLGGLSLAGACLVYWFGGVATGFCGMIGYLFSVIRGPKRAQQIFAAGILSVVAIAICVTLTARVSIPILFGNGGDLFTELSAPPQHRISLLWLNIPIQQIVPIDDWEQFKQMIKGTKIPSSVIWLGGISVVINLFLITKKKLRLSWLLAGVFAVGVPIGAAVNYKGILIPSGYAFLHTFFPPLSRCHDIERMMIAPCLIILIFAAMTIAEATLMLPKVFRSSVRFGLGLGLLMVGLSFAPDKSSARYAPFPREEILLQATAKYPGGIIDVPLIRSEHNYIHELYHNQPILGGPGLNRVMPPEQKHYIDQNRFIETLNRMSIGKSPQSFPNSDYEKLYQDGFRLLVIDKRDSKAKPTDYEELIGAKGFTHSKRRLYIIPMPESLLNSRKPDKDLTR